MIWSLSKPRAAVVPFHLLCSLWWMNSSSSLTNFSSFKVLFVCGSPRRFLLFCHEKARKKIGEKQKKDEFFSFSLFLFSLFFSLSCFLFSLVWTKQKLHSHKSFSSVLRRRGKKKTNNTKKTKTKTNWRRRRRRERDERRRRRRRYQQQHLKISIIKRRKSTYI